VVVVVVVVVVAAAAEVKNQRCTLSCVLMFSDCRWTDIALVTLKSQPQNTFPASLPRDGNTKNLLPKYREMLRWNERRRSRDLFYNFENF